MEVVDLEPALDRVVGFVEADELLRRRDEDVAADRRMKTVAPIRMLILN